MKKDWYTVLHSSLADLARGKTSEFLQPRLFLRKRNQRPVRAPWMLRRMRVFYIINLLARLVKANAPLAQGLSAATPSAPSWALSRSLYALSRDLERGLSLDQAMRRQPKIFPAVYADLVEAGQKSGALEQTLTDIMGGMTDTKSVVREVKEVVGYFALVLAIFAMFSWFLNMKVIPVFAELCHAIDVPSNYVAWHTFQVSEAVGSYWEWYTAGAGLLALVVALTLLPSRLDRTFAPSRRVRKMLSEFALRTPLVGRLAKSANLATSMQMLAQLLKAGVPLDVALDDAASASINPSFAAAFGRMRDKVRQGMALSKAAESEWWFIPKAVAVAMANAEYHGDLAGAMQNLAMFYRAKTFRQMKMIKPLLLPLVVLVLGSLVLIQYTSIFIGLMNMGERIMGGM